MARNGHLPFQHLNLKFSKASKSPKSSCFKNPSIGYLGRPYISHNNIELTYLHGLSLTIWFPTAGSRSSEDREEQNPFIQCLEEDLSDGPQPHLGSFVEELEWRGQPMEQLCRMASRERVCSFDILVRRRTRTTNRILQHYSHLFRPGDQNIDLGHETRSRYRREG